MVGRKLEEHSQRGATRLARGAIASEERKWSEGCEAPMRRSSTDQCFATPDGRVGAEAGAVPCQTEDLLAVDGVLGHARGDVCVVVLHADERDLPLVAKSF